MPSASVKSKESDHNLNGAQEVDNLEGIFVELQDYSESKICHSPRYDPVT